MTVRRVRCWVRIGGVLVPALKTHVTRKSKRSADTFSASLSIRLTKRVGFDYAQWADFQPTDVTIVNQVTAGNPVDMVTGQVDEPVINWKDGTVGISGRDKSASLIEKRSSQKFPNNKISEVVKTFAQNHGLTPSIVETDAIAGKTYNKDTVHLQIDKTDFEAMSDLADSVGYRWYVDGTSLVFEPKEQGSDVAQFYWYPPGTRAAYIVSNCTDLRTARNMTAAKPHNVKVKSWNHEQKKLVVGEKNSGGVGDAIDITHFHNGRTKDQADRIANSRLKDAIRHDCNVTISAVADLSMTARKKASLVGTGTIYDQVYDVDSVEIDTSWQSGATMDLECKAPKAGRDGDESGLNSKAPSGTPTGTTATPPQPVPRPADIDQGVIST